LNTYDNLTGEDELLTFALKRQIPTGDKSDGWNPA